jgi:hypothetical protein
MNTKMNSTTVWGAGRRTAVVAPAATETTETGGWAAFGRRDEARVEQFRQAQVREAAEARVKRDAEAAEAKRLADAMNYTSEDLYPSLGPGSGGGAVRPATRRMNFKQVVSDLAARDAAERETAEFEASVAAANAWKNTTLQPVPLRRVTRIQVQASEDTDSEAEEDDANSWIAPEVEVAGLSAESADMEDGEFNAHIGVRHKRGDLY